jgi:hypothetical protein
MSNQWASDSLKREKRVLPIAVRESINIDDQEQSDVILMMDDVGVQAQKPPKKRARLKDDVKRIDTTVVLIRMDSCGMARRLKPWIT